MPATSQRASATARANAINSRLAQGRASSLSLNSMLRSTRSPASDCYRYPAFSLERAQGESNRPAASFRTSPNQTTWYQAGFRVFQLSLKGSFFQTHGGPPWLRCLALESGKNCTAARSKVRQIGRSGAGLPVHPPNPPEGSNWLGSAGCYSLALVCRERSKPLPRLA